MAKLIEDDRPDIPYPDLLVLMLLSPVSLLFRCWISNIIASWYLPGIFTVPMLVGLWLIVGLIVGSNMNGGSKYKNLSSSIASSIIWPLLVLSIAAVMRLFV